MGITHGETSSEERGDVYNCIAFRLHCSHKQRSTVKSDREREREGEGKGGIDCIIAHSYLTSPVSNQQETEAVKLMATSGRTVRGCECVCRKRRHAKEVLCLFFFFVLFRLWNHMSMLSMGHGRDE
jgi:hypothetical protein